MKNEKYYTIKRFRKWSKAKQYVDKELKGYIFRGQANSEWSLETNIERIAKLYNQNISKENFESKMYNEFMKIGRNYINQFPENYIECFALMQHYGGCTRFLDFSKSFYIATFFAFENILKHKNQYVNPAIWAIDYSKLIPEMSDRLGNKRKFPSRNIKELNAPLNDLLKMIVEMGVEGTYKIEGNYKKQIYEKGIFCIEPDRLIDRMEIQQGLFLVPSNFEYSFLENLLNSFNDTEVYKYIVKIELSGQLDSRKEIISDLKKMNISPKTLFPGIEGLMKNLKYCFLEKWDEVDGVYINRKYK